MTEEKKAQWRAQAAIDMVEFSDDVDELMKIAENTGVDYTREQVTIAWLMHSDDFSAGWMCLEDSAAFHLGRWIDAACATAPW